MNQPARGSLWGSLEHPLELDSQCAEKAGLESVSVSGSGRLASSKWSFGVCAGAGVGKAAACQARSGAVTCPLADSPVQLRPSQGGCVARQAGSSLLNDP